MKRYLTAVISWLRNHWRGLVVSILLALLAALTLSLQLSSLVPGENQFETNTVQDIQTFPKPWDKAINAPYTIPAYLVGQAINDPLHGARLVSVVYGLLATALMFYIIRVWFNIRAATVGALLFITSSWLLHITHMATPLIMLVFAPLLAIAPLAWFMRTKKYWALSFFLLGAALAISAYVPYMPWIIAILFGVVLIFERKLFRNLQAWQIIAAASVYAIILLPLLVSLFHAPGQLNELFGIPKDLPTIKAYATNFVYTISMLVFYAQPLPAINLGHLPVLDIFSATMFAMGIYHFATRIKCRRSIILFVSTGLLLLLVPLSPIYQLSATILLSFVYIFVLSGIIELLNQWFSYFPRNPWARNFGVAMIVIAIAFASFYHLQRYFIAWPNAPETKAAYLVATTKKPN